MSIQRLSRATIAIVAATPDEQQSTSPHSTISQIRKVPVNYVEGVGPRAK